MKTNKERVRLYQQARQAGMNACRAWRTSKTLVAWNKAERRGIVRLRAEHEEENYFDVYGEPEAYTDINGRRVTAEQARKELEDTLDAKGCYCVIGERLTCRKCGTWEQADNIGMCAGYDNPLDWRENWYVPYIMAMTLKAAGIEA